MSVSSIPSSAHGYVQPGDGLVRDLLAALPGLFSVALTRDEEISTAITRADLDPHNVQTEAMKRADEVLRSTNNEIVRLRAAKDRLITHERLPARRRKGRSTLPLIPAHRRIGLGLWLAVIFPIIVWRVWPYASTALGGFWSTLIFIASGAALTSLAAWSIKAGAKPLSLPRPDTSADDPEKRLGDPAGDFGVLAIGVALGISYALLVWRLWDHTSHVLGSGWAWTIWIAVGVLMGGAAMAALIGSLTLLGEDMVAQGWLVLLGFVLAISFGLVSWDLVSYFLPNWHGGVLVGGTIALLIATYLPSIARSFRIAFMQLIRLMPIPRRDSRNDPLLLGRRGRRRHHEMLKAAVATEEQRWRQAASAIIVPILREQINLMRTPIFSTTLEKMNFGGLKQMRSVDHVIETHAFDRFKALLESLSGGAVGLAGPRGVGKSTLLEFYHSGRMTPAGTEHLSLFESVPVRYDARDYALHLYVVLCDQVVKFRNTSFRAQMRVGSRFASALRAGGSAFALFLALIGVTYLSVISIVGWRTLPVWLQRTWWALPSTVGLVLFATVLAYRHPVLKDRAVSLDEVDDLASLKSYASQKLNSIRYQLRRTSGWSGTMGLPMSGGRTRSRSIELSSLPMAYPDVVNDFRTFLTRTVSILRAEPNIGPVPVSIILDELDKIPSSDRVQEFLNEVKGLFTIDVPGCLFLVSVSEDALAAFDRRGLPIRDAFDSAFNAILAVEYLDLADATRMLRSRVVRLAAPFIALSYCLSGGLPRELVRYARETVVDPESDLAAISSRLVTEELRRKARAFETIMARNTYPEPFASNLVSYIDSYLTSSVEMLLDALSKPPLSRDDVLEMDNSTRAFLIGLQTEALSHFYYYATILEVFSNLTEQVFSEIGLQGGNGSFDTLASARRQFSLNARLAWLTVSRFRDEWGLRVLEPPVIA